MNLARSIVMKLSGSGHVELEEYEEEPPYATELGGMVAANHFGGGGGGGGGEESVISEETFRAFLLNSGGNINSLAIDEGNDGADPKVHLQSVNVWLETQLQTNAREVLTDQEIHTFSAICAMMCCGKGGINRDQYTHTVWQVLCAMCKRPSPLLSTLGGFVEHLFTFSTEGFELLMQDWITRCLRGEPSDPAAPLTLYYMTDRLEFRTGNVASWFLRRNMFWPLVQILEVWLHNPSQAGDTTSLVHTITQIAKCTTKQLQAQKRVASQQTRDLTTSQLRRIFGLAVHRSTAPAEYYNSVLTLARTLMPIYQGGAQQVLRELISVTPARAACYSQNLGALAVAWAQVMPDMIVQTRRALIEALWLAIRNCKSDEGVAQILLALAALCNRGVNPKTWRKFRSQAESTLGRRSKAFSMFLALVLNPTPECLHEAAVKIKHTV